MATYIAGVLKVSNMICNSGVCICLLHLLNVCLASCKNERGMIRKKFPIPRPFFLCFCVDSEPLLSTELGVLQALREVRCRRCGARCLPCRPNWSQHHAQWDNSEKANPSWTAFHYQHRCLSRQRVTSHSEGKIRNSPTCASL